MTTNSGFHRLTHPFVAYGDVFAIIASQKQTVKQVSYIRKATSPDGTRPGKWNLLDCVLSRTLVVGNAFRFGGPRVFRGKGQNNQGDQIRQHPIEVGADADIGQEIYAVSIDVDTGIAGRPHT